jgi:hypothetical protein
MPCILVTVINVALHESVSFLGKRVPCGKRGPCGKIMPCGRIPYGTRVLYGSSRIHSTFTFRFSLLKTKWMYGMQSELHL